MADAEKALCPRLRAGGGRTLLKARAVETQKPRPLSEARVSCFHVCCASCFLCSPCLEDTLLLFETPGRVSAGPVPRARAAGGDLPCRPRGPRRPAPHPGSPSPSSHPVLTPRLRTPATPALVPPQTVLASAFRSVWSVFVPLASFLPPVLPVALPWRLSSKASACQCWKRVRSLGGEEPLEKGTATHCSIRARRIPRAEEPGGLQSIGSQRVRHD